ncbi:hypothetical protein AYL99_11045 [Fonsecaea erecta]|uniref:Uncharacterized protein n=1 Tax=Fonsecaea erecta TaxID=1367422 RepID=A0A178Z4D3_9EURO|nr:hypothetical protein AYL99_11045 [Fonsecaea erecta]OAP54597.1 hypothetical protein AYL99_11045 [Fonsecaea erecta]
MDFVATSPEAYFQGRIDHSLHCDFLSDHFTQGFLSSRNAIDLKRNYVVVVPANSVTSLGLGSWHDGGLADTGFHHYDRPTELADDGPVSVRLAKANGLLFIAVEFPGPGRGLNPLQDESIITAYGPPSVVKLLKRLWETYDSLSLLLWLYPAELADEIPPGSLLDSWSRQLGAIHGALTTSMMGTASDYLGQRVTEVAKGDEYAHDESIDEMYEIIGLHCKTDVFLQALQSEQVVENKLRIWITYRDELSFLRDKMNRRMHLMKTRLDMA